MTKERIIGILLTAMGLFIAFGTMAMKVTMSLSQGDPGPKLFLYIAAIGLIICGVGVAVSNSTDAKTLSLDKQQTKKFVFLFLVMAAYLVGLNVLGFLISTPIAIVAFIYILKQEKQVKLLSVVIFSGVFTAILYFVFVRLLSIILPKGMLF